jgi:hypothetical protein
MYARRRRGVPPVDRADVSARRRRTEPATRCDRANRRTASLCGPRSGRAKAAGSQPSWRSQESRSRHNPLFADSSAARSRVASRVSAGGASSVARTRSGRPVTRVPIRIPIDRSIDRSVSIVDRASYWPTRCRCGNDDRGLADTMSAGRRSPLVGSGHSRSIEGLMSGRSSQSRTRASHRGTGARERGVEEASNTT